MKTETTLGPFIDCFGPMPMFPGGGSAMSEFLIKNLTVPKRVSGPLNRIVARFDVDKKGWITNAKIVKSSGYGLMDSEVLRVISIMPKWEPAKKNGKPVSSHFMLPIIVETQ